MNNCKTKFNVGLLHKICGYNGTRDVNVPGFKKCRTLFLFNTGWSEFSLVTHSVASWVMLLKVKGATVLMLLLLKSLSTNTVESATSQQGGPVSLAACWGGMEGRRGYIHQGELLQGGQLLRNRRQLVPLQVPDRKQAGIISALHGPTSQPAGFRTSITT